MANNESILEQARSKGLATPGAGMSVPPGYFEDFAARMAESLPYRAEAEAPEAVAAALPKSFWMRVRPFVYMAAMFAGIWLMLQMFAMMGGQSRLKPLDQNPILAEALSDDDFVFDYFYDDYSSYELYDEMSSDYSDAVLSDGSSAATPDNIILTDTTLI